MIIDREWKLGGRNYRIEKRVGLTEINSIEQSRA